MGLFGSDKPKTQPAPAPELQREKRRSLFGSNEPRQSSTLSRKPVASQSIIHRPPGPITSDTLQEARKRFIEAQQAEKEAHDAVRVAEQRLQDARNHLKLVHKALDELEREAKEEAAAAQSKAKEASYLRQEADKLGRKEY